MCSIWKHASTERGLSLRFFQEAQHDCERSIQSVPTASCLQYRPSLVRDTRPWKSPLNACKQRHSSTISNTPGLAQSDLTKGHVCRSQKSVIPLTSCTGTAQVTIALNPLPIPQSCTIISGGRDPSGRNVGLVVSSLSSEQRGTAQQALVTEHGFLQRVRLPEVPGQCSDFSKPKHTSTCQVTTILQKVDC